MNFSRHLKWWIFLVLCTRAFVEGHFKLCLHIKHTCVYLSRQICRKNSAFDLLSSLSLSLFLPLFLSCSISFFPFFFHLPCFSLIYFFHSFSWFFILLFIMFVSSVCLSFLHTRLPACLLSSLLPFPSLTLHSFLLLFLFPNLAPSLPSL